MGKEERNKKLALKLKENIRRRKESSEKNTDKQELENNEGKENEKRQNNRNS